MKRLISECPHCYGKLELEVTPKFYRSKYDQHFLSDMTILCVSTLEDRAFPFFKKMREHADYLGAEFFLVGDCPTEEAYEKLLEISSMNIAHRLMMVKSKGYIESVLTSVYEDVKTTWAMRLDDDEEMSSGLVQWIKDRKHMQSKKWQVPTMNLYSPQEYFVEKPLFPDIHLRLSTWKTHPKVSRVHDGFALAPLCPYSILHHKFVIKPYEERIKIAERYDLISEGAGTGTHLPFNLPEDYFTDGTYVADILDGRVVDKPMDGARKVNLTILDK